MLYSDFIRIFIPGGTIENLLTRKGYTITTLGKILSNYFNGEFTLKEISKTYCLSSKVLQVPIAYRAGEKRLLGRAVKSYISELEKHIASGSISNQNNHRAGLYFINNVIEDEEFTIRSFTVSSTLRREIKNLLITELEVSFIY